MKNEKIEKLIEERRKLNDRNFKIHLELISLVKKECDKLGISDKIKNKSISIGSWNCLNSPIGYCIYDDCEDHCHDFCLFCQEPDERK